ncbi:MAG: AraC family transcriptional regulator [Clostridia bacterium]|nr:AraC family transcriptional regulator [Clostridia bacterium]
MMGFGNELSLMMDTFHKCHVPIVKVLGSMPLSSLIPSGLSPFFATACASYPTVDAYLGKLSPYTLYRKQDSFSFSYRYLLLPASDSILFIGPFLSQPMTADTLNAIAVTLGVNGHNLRYLEEILSAIPILESNDPLLLLLDSFCERSFQSKAFAISDVCMEESISLADPLAYREAFDDTLVNMKAMERRYRFENELIEAVAQGQLHKESLFTPALSTQYFEQRTRDPLRNAQNYCIIMNTLLRKAAERGNVHPLHLNATSSQFAKKIEQLHRLGDALALMREMFLSYCRLVRQNAAKAYSRVVKEAILLIEAELSAPLTLKTLAAKLSVSSGYLSTVFKKESGRTLSEYIREKRIAYAAYLLRTTSLQVQTVAAHCGILDVQYFSKLFKKEMGKTPREYRETAARTV